MIGLAVIGMPRKAMVESILSYWTGLTVNLTPQQLQVISSSLHAPLSLNVETHDEVTLDLLGFAFVDRVVRLGVHFSIVVFSCHNVFWEIISRQYWHCVFGCERLWGWLCHYLLEI